MRLSNRAAVPKGATDEVGGGEVLSPTSLSLSAPHEAEKDEVISRLAMPPPSEAQRREAEPEQCHAARLRQLQFLSELEPDRSLEILETVR